MKDTKKGKPSENNDFDNKEPGDERSSSVLKAFIIKCPTATDQDGPRNIRFAMHTTPTGGGGGGPPGGSSSGSPGGPPSGPPPGEPSDGPPGRPPGRPPGEAEHIFEFPRMAAVYVVPLVTGPGDEPQEAVVPNPPRVHHYLELQGFNRNIQVAVAAEERAVWPLGIAPAFAHNLGPNTAPAERTPSPNDPTRTDTVALLHAAAAQHAARETVDIARTPQELLSAEERGPDDRTRLTAAAGQYSLHEGSGSLPLPQFWPRPASLADGAMLAHDSRPPLNPLDNALQLATSLPDPGAEHQHDIATVAASGHHQDASVTTSPSTPATQVPADVLGNCWLCPRPPNVALLPCGHLVVCNACAPRVVFCPKCTRFVDKHIQVYIP